jgi:hypothetical protein
VTFKHAYRNGQWNVYEAVSFDLADEDGIKRKAREWLGHLAAVVDDGDVEPFKPHFLVGALQRGHESCALLLGQFVSSRKKIVLQINGQRPPSYADRPRNLAISGMMPSSRTSS